MPGESKSAPLDKNIFIYMQIVHVSSISTTEQTFHAKFYFRATWVQELPYDNKLITLQPEVKPIEDRNDWPENVYMPSVAFDNAKEEIEYKGQTLGVSNWRKVIDQPGRDPAEDSLVVVEWKASGCGVFSQKFALTNFPCDIQLLKIVISSLDQRITLHDDHRDKVESCIRKDYFVDQGFIFQISDGKSETPQGVAIESREEAFNINPTNGRGFNTLTYLIQAKRIDHHAKREILHPVTLITLAVMFSFLFPPGAPNDRLAVSITISLVMMGYLYVVTNYLPRTTETHLINWYVSFSYWFVFLVVLQNAVIAAIACKGGYCGQDADSPTTMVTTESSEISSRFLVVISQLSDVMNVDDNDLMKIPDVVFLVIFSCVWLFVNAYVYAMVYYKMKINEKERIDKELKPARDGTTEVSPLYKYYNPTTVAVSDISDYENNIPPA